MSCPQAVSLKRGILPLLAGLVRISCLKPGHSCRVLSCWPSGVECIDSAQIPTIDICVCFLGLRWQSVTNGVAYDRNFVVSRFWRNLQSHTPSKPRRGTLPSLFLAVSVVLWAADMPLCSSVFTWFSPVFPHGCRFIWTSVILD